MTSLTFLAAILLSSIAGYYSIIGLALIFPGAFWPVVIMGVSLEFSKLVTASWLYRNWDIAPKLLKIYLTFAVFVLMLITSMGIFGFLSKAHIEHSTELAPMLDKVAAYDDSIVTLKQQLDENKKVIKQMDESVDQVILRSTTENSVLKSIQIRKSQQKERRRLSDENQNIQKQIAKITENKTPHIAELRKTEADLGPIKYVAELVYGNSEQDIIEKAVRMVIVIIMIVFDPLAVLLLISANISMKKKSGLSVFERSRFERNIVPTRTTVPESKPESEVQKTVVVPKSNIANIDDTNEGVLNFITEPEANTECQESSVSHYGHIYTVDNK